MRFHQFVPVVDPGDAVANHARAIRDVLMAEGIESHLYCQQAHPTLAAQTRSVSEDRGGPAMYHVAIGSELADHVMGRGDDLVLDHHHLTPTRFFTSWDPGLVHGTAWGRRQLPPLARRCTLGLADSHYNAEDLLHAGCRDVEVLPILFDPERFHRPSDPATAETLDRARDGGGAQWLFVGRVVPNKAQHDVVSAFAVYRRQIDPAARLWLVGGASSPAYETALRGGIAALGLGDAVTLTGPVSQEALTSYFEGADVFVCASEHEGFCVPLLEAMFHRLPIVARAAAAVPETLGAAGLLVEQRSPAHLAMAVERILRDRPLREALAVAQQARLSDFAPERTRRRLLELLAPWICA